jgi:hypothetical protein
MASAKGGQAVDTCPYRMAHSGGERLVAVRLCGYALSNLIVLIAQWIERLVAVQKVAGSIPAKDTLLYSAHKLRREGRFPATKGFL